MKPGRRIAIVVPTFNEVHNLPQLVERLFSLQLPTLELIIVDDNSPDGTGRMAEQLAQRYPGRIQVVHREAKLGLGTAYIEGFRRALERQADIIIQMDADLSHPPEYIPTFLHMLESSDVVVGSRYVRGGHIDGRWHLGRRLLSRLGNVYARWASGLRVRDATSGFKAFRRRVLEHVDLRSFRCRGFAFQAEVAHTCQRLGYRMVEYPIHFAERLQGRSKISWNIIWEALWTLPQLRWSQVRRQPARHQASS